MAGGPEGLNFHGLPAFPCVNVTWEAPLARGSHNCDSKDLWEHSKSLNKQSWQWEGALAPMRAVSVSHTHTLTHSHMHSDTHSHTCTHPHTCTLHTLTCTLTPSHSHTLSHSANLSHFYSSCLFCKTGFIAVASDPGQPGSRRQTARREAVGCELKLGVHGRPWPVPPAGLSGNQATARAASPWSSPRTRLAVPPFQNSRVPQARSDGSLLLYIFS